MHKKKFILLLIFIVIVLLTSCSSDWAAKKILEQVDTSDTDEYLEISFKSIADHDYGSFISVFEYDVSEEEFNSISQSLPEISGAELTGYDLGGYFYHFSGGQKSYEYNYNVQSSAGDYIVQIILTAEDGGRPAFMWFHIEPGHLDNYTPKIVGISSAQIFVLLYTGLCWALIIFAIISCLKSKVKLRILWIFGILIQNGITITKTASSANYTVNFFYIGISKLVLSKADYFSLTLVFPIIAVIFLLLKKILIKNQEKRKADLEAQEEELSRASIERLSEKNTNVSEILTASETQDEE